MPPTSQTKLHLHIEKLESKKRAPQSRISKPSLFLWQWPLTHVLALQQASSMDHGLIPFRVWTTSIAWFGCTNICFKLDSCDLDFWPMTLTINTHHPQNIWSIFPGKYDDEPLDGSSVMCICHLGKICVFKYIKKIICTYQMTRCNITLPQFFSRIIKAFVCMQNVKVC